MSFILVCLICVSTSVVGANDTNIEKIVNRLKSLDVPSNNLFQHEKPDGTWAQSTLYKWEDMVSSVEMMMRTGVGNLTLWHENEEEGLVNIAAMLAQSMQETIRYNACDENNWSDPSVINPPYPATSACGQLGQSYQNYHCTDDENDLAIKTGGKKMECPVDINMMLKANTHAQWYGAPPGLFCAPRSKISKAPRWDYSTPWCDPQKQVSDPPFPEGIMSQGYIDYVNNGGNCRDYKDIKTGGWTLKGCDETKGCTNGSPYDRTDLEGCCWWGRGVIQSTGVCNYGKLNYYLGKRADEEGRNALFPTIDFCQSPDAICQGQNPTLKWIAGLFYYMESVQSYNQNGFNYLSNLKKWVENGKNLSDSSFINAVSGIVNRGSPFITAHNVQERAENFKKVMNFLYNLTELLE